MTEFSKKSMKYLQAEFGLAIQKSTSGVSRDELVPSSLKGMQINLPSDLDKALSQWKNSTTTDKRSMHQRIKLWEMLDQMAHNNGPVSKTIKLYKNETIGSNMRQDPIEVKAKTRKQEKWIKKFLQDIGYTKSTLEAIVEDLVIFGNALSINSLDPAEGITESTPSDPFSLQERVEFNPVRIKHQVEGSYSGYTELASNDPRMVQFVKAVQDPNMTTSEYFKSTLMGFKIDDFEFAPWQVAHFRMPSSRHEFAPYGKPVLLPALAPYMAWKATKDMIALARVASFPKEIVTLHGAANIAPDMMFTKLQDLKELDQNLAEDSAQDTFGVGSKKYTIDGVFSYNLKETKMDLSAIGDLDADEENVISALDVPIAYLIQGKDKGFGESNKTLVAQSKVFAKAVYSIQSVILETLVTQVKIQMLLTGEYDPETDYFELSMPLPSVDDDPELVRLYQEKLRLAKDTAETIRDLLGFPQNAKLPAETIRSILTGLSAAPDEELDMWVETIANETVVEEPEGTDEPLIESSKIKSKLTEELFREAVIKTRESSNLREGLENERHYMTSSNTSKLDKRMLEDIEVKLTRVRLEETNQKEAKGTKLKESIKVSNSFKEDIYSVKERLPKETKSKYIAKYKAKK